jgi:hypothetical protein
MSSPRVLRTVVTMPASCSTAQSLHRSRGERFRPEAGNGLKGIRLSLQGTRRASGPGPAPERQLRACSGLSLTPSSMQYSKVMKSRGAASR